MSISTFHFREIEDLIYNVIFEDDGKTEVVDELNIAFEQFRNLYQNDKTLETIIRGTQNFSTDDLDISEEELEDLSVEDVEKLEKDFVKKFNSFSKDEIHEITRCLSFMYGIAYAVRRFQK